VAFITDLFGNKTTDSVLNKIDQIIDNLQLKQNNQLFDDLVTGAIKDVIDFEIAPDKDKDKSKPKKNIDEVEQLLQGITIPESRLKRYDTYDDLYKSIQLVKRIIRVYVNNIFQKNSITNTMFLVKESEKSKNYEQLDNVKRTTKEIISFFKLEEKLKYSVAFNVLKYGDSFVEIVDLDSVTTEFPVVTSTKDDAIITETYNQIMSKNPYKSEHLLIENLDNFINCLVEFDNNIYCDVESELIEEEKFDEEVADSVKYNLKKILLNYHKPHRIVPLMSPYDTVLGFVEINETERATTSTNILKQFTDIIDKIGSKHSTNEKYETLIRDFSKLIIKKTLMRNNTTKKHNMTSGEYADSIKKTLNDDLYYSLKRVLLSANENTLFRKKLKIRYIKPDDMIWFRTPGSDFYPFGMSVIDPLVFPGKLYLFTHLANTVYKLSKASQIRKWTVETGSKQDHSALLQKLKQQFKNMRITASDLTSTKDMPNILSDFRDMVVKIRMRPLYSNL